MNKKIGELSLNEFIKILNDCTGEKIHKCKYCPLQDIECNCGHLSNFDLGKLDLEQEIAEKKY